MELFIRIKDGQPFEHPILGDNFRAAFPGVDTNNLPPEFARFERFAPPTPGPYEIYEGVTYEWIDGWVKDVHRVRPMTAEEKLAKQNLAKEQWAQQSGLPSWVFNEETCLFDPPVPYPNDGLAYAWDEPSVSWQPLPPPDEQAASE